MADSDRMTLEQALELALGHHRAGRFPAAEQVYHRIIQAAPTHPDAYHLWGLALHQQGNNTRAVEFIRKAISLAPQIANMYNSLGAALAALGQHAEAVKAYREGIRQNPNAVEAYNNLGISLRVMKEHEEAIAVLRQALQLKPNYHEAHNNLAICHVALGELDEAVEQYEAAMKIDPTFTPAINNLGNARQQQGQVQLAIEYHRRAIELRPDYLDAHNNLLYCLLLDPNSDSAEILDEHVKWAKQFVSNHEQVPRVNVVRDPNRPLRIGYVSPDFRNHAVAHFIMPILTRHDRSQFHAYCYAEVQQSDDVTQQVQHFLSGWRSTMGRSDIEMARQIADDQIDILVDLAGHTARNRLLMFAHKPAPIQVSYLGYPATTGLGAIDYYLTNEFADPPDAQQYYTEKLFRLPGLFCCYQPHGNAPEVGPSPAEKRGYVTFGSLHKLARLTDEVVALWASILAACPNSRLFLFRDTLRGQTRETIQERFVAQGIGPDRLEFDCDLNEDEVHLSKYNEIDILLDTFPWSGHTTACEALWMGVPVVTLMGNAHAGRMVADVLTHTEHADWVAETPDDYREIARHLAQNIEELSKVRLGLREQLASSVLLDPDAFARKMEQAYRAMWQRYCEV